MDSIDDCERVLSARCLKLKNYTALNPSVKAEQSLQGRDRPGLGRSHGLRGDQCLLHERSSSEVLRLPCGVWLSLGILAVRVF